jgi:hypothetical protein
MDIERSGGTRADRLRRTLQHPLSIWVGDRSRRQQGDRSSSRRDRALSPIPKGR